jgi:uncharacterized protein (UPF0261 family)
MAVVIVGMLDEREEALRIIRDRIRQNGHSTCLVDISIGTGAIVPTLEADVTPRDLARLAEASAGMRTERGDAPSSVVAEGLKAKIAALLARGELQGMIAITGMTGALIALPAMKQLPFGMPKVLISGATGQPVHAAKFGEYFALRDITLMHTVVDTVGMNPLVRALALNGADAISGMVGGGPRSLEGDKATIGITEFGYCDKGAHYIRQNLESDYEIISIHAMGVGDKAALDLAPQGVFKAFVDLVSGSFSEHLLGGNRDAGPERLDLAATLPIPYIFCPGGMDMISCGPVERRDRGDPLWMSRRLAERKLHLQPPRVQARTSPEEMEQVGTAVAERLNRYERKGRVKAIIPLKGLSSLSVEGGPLYDPVADQALSAALKSRLDPAIELVEVEADINSPVFAEAVTDALSRAFSSLTYGCAQDKTRTRAR